MVAEVSDYMTTLTAHLLLLLVLNAVPQLLHLCLQLHLPRLRLLQADPAHLQLFGQDLQLLTVSLCPLLEIQLILLLLLLRALLKDFQLITSYLLG